MAEKAKDFKIIGIDNGFCRVEYSAVNPQGQKVYYCLQDEGVGYGGVICYRCSRDGEPSHQVRYVKDRFEVPTGDSSIEVTVREYLLAGEAEDGGV